MPSDISDNRWRGRLAWSVVPPLSRGLGRLAWGLRITVLPDSLPPPPFVVAANHHSFLDAFLVAAALPERIRFLALQDLYGNYRWVDFALDSFDVIPLSRGVVPMGPVRAALRHLDTGGVVGLFPEGTRHWEFEPDRVKGGAAWLAARTDVPLLPVAIAGSDRVLGVDNRLRRGKIQVVVGNPLRAEAATRSAVDDLKARWSGWVADTLVRSGARELPPT